VQKSVREKAGVNAVLDEDLARRMRQIDNTPALMSSLALLRNQVENEKWDDANRQAVLVGYGMGVLWAKVPAYVKLDAAQSDLREGSVERMEGLTAVVQAAMAAEEWKVAREAATELATKATGAPRHDGLTTLGLLDLRAGEANTAETWLLQAGKVEADVALKQRGPRTDLARALVETGRRSVVLKYLVEVEKWGWREGAKLLVWREEMLAGKLPDFN
jgi:hypothetical protein